MQIYKIDVNDNLIFGNTSIEFNSTTKINTVSGKNGSGKTTLLSLATLVQKAYFCTLLEEQSSNATFKSSQIRTLIGKEANKYLKNINSKVSISLCFEKNDFQLLRRKRPMDLWNQQKNNDGLITVTLDFVATAITNDIVSWELTLDANSNKILLLFWNLSNPINFITYIPAERNVLENDIRYEDVRLIAEKGVSSKLNVIFDFNGLYNNMYSVMLTDYILQRIVPGKGINSKDYYIAQSRNLFSSLIPNIKVDNFSSGFKKNQFILTAVKDGMKYDIRNFSSGEKLIWYTSVLINYVKNMGVLIIDEPENHLHETLLWNFIQMLQHICDDKKNEITLSQVFLLTHSKNLIYNNFVEGTNYVIETNGVHELEYNNYESKLRDMGISYINERILFVEGTTDQSTLQDIFSKYNIQVKVLGNCEAIISTYEGIQHISSFLQDKRFVFLLDKDTRDENEITLLRDHNPNYFDEHVVFLEKHEIENYYLDEKIIVHIINQINSILDKPSCTEDEIKAIIKENADNTREQTQKKYLNYLLHIKLHHMDSLFKLKDIPSTSNSDYDNYIENVFSSNDWTDSLCEMKSAYSKMTTKYSDTEWSSNWKNLCDGKMVFHRSLSQLRTITSVSNDTLEKKIKKEILQDSSSELSLLIDKIVSLYN